MDASSDQRTYAIQHVLGKGGFGTVYRARLQSAGGFSKEVALKVLHPELASSSDTVRRLRDEARMLGLLRHRAIVQVDALIRLDDRWAIIMEFVEGASVRELLQQPLPASVALEITGEVAAALDTAWRKPGPEGEPLRLLHRDIKPGNIQITDGGDVKLLDFGVARADFGEREAQTRSLIFGSVHYLAPERMDFEDTHLGDVYALGATLYEMIVGEPFGKASINPRKHAEKVVEARSRLEGMGLDDLAPVVARCLDYEPEDRPDARELERLCRTLRRRHERPWLRDWAEQAVPTAQSRRETSEDGWSGAVLSESGVMHASSTMAFGPDDLLDDEAAPAPDRPAASPARPTSPSPVPTSGTRRLRRRRGWLFGLLASAVLLLSLLVVVLVGLPVAGATIFYAVLSWSGIWEEAWIDTIRDDYQALEIHVVDPMPLHPGRERVRKLLVDGRDRDKANRIGLWESVFFEQAVEDAASDGTFDPREVRELEQQYQKMIAR
jgi:serine/threonine protein kinase